MKKRIIEIIVKTQGMLPDYYYVAEVKSDKQLRATGDTAAGAIGHLLIQRQKELGFKISDFQLPIR